MRRGWILLLLLAALALPVSAVDVLAQERQILQVDSLTDPLSGQTREALEDYSPASQTDPASAILDIFKWASNLSVGTLREAVQQTFSFVLTETDGSKRYGYCRRWLRGDGRRAECACVMAAASASAASSGRAMSFMPSSILTMVCT